MGSKSPLQDNAIRPDEVRLGRVSGIFGLVGEVRLFLHNRETKLFTGAGMDVTLVSPDGQRASRLLRSRTGAGKRVLGKIEGVTTTEGARALMEWEIVVAESALPAPSAGEFYQRDLLGLTVRTAQGQLVGEIIDVMEGAAVDCWVVKGDRGEFILPAIKEIIVSVDLADGVVISSTIDELKE